MVVVRLVLGLKTEARRTSESGLPAGSVYYFHAQRPPGIPRSKVRHQNIGSPMQLRRRDFSAAGTKIYVVVPGNALVLSTCFDMLSPVVVLVALSSRNNNYYYDFSINDSTYYYS